MGMGSAILPPQYSNNLPQQGAGINQVRNWAQSNGLGRNAVQQYMARHPAGQVQQPGGMVQKQPSDRTVQQPLHDLPNIRKGGTTAQPRPMINPFN